MALEYAIAQEVRAALPEGMTQGQLLLTLDSQKVAHFVGIYRDQPKAADQLTVDFRLRNLRVKLASNSFFSSKRAKPTTSTKPNMASLELANGESCCW